MTQRGLYLAAYDVSDPKRLRAGLKIVKGYATGGQKSAYECFLSAAEKRVLLEDMSALVEQHEDSFLLIALDPRCKVHALGIAALPVDPDYFYLA